MYELALSSVFGSVEIAGRWFPETIDTNCPFCAKMVNFKTVSYHHDTIRGTTSASAICPGCRKTVFVWAIQPRLVKSSNREDCARLVMYPAPKISRQPIEGANLLPDRIRRAYLDVLSVFNTGVWTATATLCRRTLEGIMSDVLPADERGQGTLATQLKKLSESVDLAKPLITLSHAVRKGGNMGAHFDLEQDPDRETAQAMVDLIEYLLEYVYTLPSMVENLDKRVDELSKKNKK